MRASPTIIAAFLIGSSPAWAHPHVFIDATIELIFDGDGLVSALRIGWTYDDLFSLSYVTENGFDPDFDGALTTEEQERIAGFDMNWAADFPGDTYALVGGEQIALSSPTEVTASYADGRLVSSHLRRLDRPIDPSAQELVVQVYDPSFYTAYTIAANPVLTGRSDCSVQVFEPDREAADQRLQAALDELAGSADTETEFPAIGDAYAEEARITCAGR